MISYMTEQLVYFVQAAESRRIKIGIARDPIHRLVILQVGSPEILDLIGVVKGGRRLEIRLHAELHAYRLHGEWFEFTDHVVAAIGELLGWGKPTPQQVEAARKADELRRAVA